jgi:hypothetical protein
MRILIAGWFSFEKMGVTAGDIMACNVLSSWLRKSDISFDIAYAAPFESGVKWQQTDPSSYTHVCFVCGPFGNGWPISEFIKHFTGVKFIGLNLTLLQSLDEWNPFDICYERDSVSNHRPDITFASSRKKSQVVGIILVHKQKEYGLRSMHTMVDKVISDFVTRQQMAPVYIDTCLEDNQGGLRTAEDVESLIARMDLCITTRLHGLVLSIKNGVPAIAIDPIAGGAKVSSQAKAISWPILLSTEQLSQENLEKAFAYCKTDEAKSEAMKCANRSKKEIDKLGEELIMKLKVI